MVGRASGFDVSIAFRLGKWLVAMRMSTAMHVSTASLNCLSAWEVVGSEVLVSEDCEGTLVSIAFRLGKWLVVVYGDAKVFGAAEVSIAFRLGKWLVAVRRDYRIERGGDLNCLSAWEVVGR